MKLLLEEVSEQPLWLGFVVKSSPFAVPIARRVVLWLASTTFPGTSVITVAPPAVPLDLQELIIKDADGGLTATRTLLFNGTVVAGDVVTANSAGSSLRYIFSTALNVWAKV